jgi:hypothetical protein
MKKISERAIEIMVERHKKECGPSDGWGSMYRFNSNTGFNYPNLSYVSVEDLGQALDWFQVELKRETQQAIDRGTDPRLFAGYSDGRS